MKPNLSLCLAAAFAVFAGCYPDLDWKQPAQSETPSQDAGQAGSAGSGGGVAGAAGSSGSGGRTSQSEAGQVADGGAGPADGVGASLPDSNPYKGMSGEDAGGTGGSSTPEAGAAGSSGSGGTSGSGGSAGSGGGIFPPDSGSSGAGGTGGAGGSNGSAGSAGSSGGESDAGTPADAGGTVKTLVVSFFAPQSMPSFSFTHMSPNSAYYFSGQACVGSGASRVCTITVDRMLSWHFWAGTGLPGALSWSPGWNGSKCLAELGVTVKENGVAVPFRMEQSGGGCHFVIDSVGTAPPNQNDLDGDGTSNASDCVKDNPSIAPGLAEICGDGLDEDCSGSDALCDGGGIPVSDAGTVGDGGSPVQIITFWIFGGPYWSSPLKFESYSPVFQTVGCQSANLTDPMTGQQNGAVVCVVNVDRSKDLEFQVQVGDKWATGYSSPPNCQKYLRIYAWNPYAVADYDDSTVTSFPQQMYSVFLGSTCHVVLPKAP